MAWRVKLSLVRYRALRNAARLRLASRRVRDCVYLWPPFAPDKLAELQGVQVKLDHYLHALNTDICYFLRTERGLDRYRYSLNQDPGAGAVTTQADANADLRRARYCVVWRWNGKPRPSSLWPHLYFVAETPECHGASDWLRLVSDMYFDRHTWPERIVPFPKTPVRTCAILGSGPSVEHFANEASQFEAWIGSNGIVFHDSICNAGSPFAFCIIDPYCFAPGDTTSTMWNSIFGLLRRTPAVFVTSSIAIGFVELNFPEDIKRKCHYIRELGRDSYGLSTSFSLSELTVTPYGNVLTDAMLPLAASISDRIVLYGCDGAPPGTNRNFPKAACVESADEAQAKESGPRLSESYYPTYLDGFRAYSEIVVRECQSRGVQIALRAPSFNSGLRHLPILANVVQGSHI